MECKIAMLVWFGCGAKMNLERLPPNIIQLFLTPG